MSIVILIGPQARACNSNRIHLLMPCYDILDESSFVGLPGDRHSSQGSSKYLHQGKTEVNVPPLNSRQQGQHFPDLRPEQVPH